MTRWTRCRVSDRETPGKAGRYFLQQWHPCWKVTPSPVLDLQMKKTEGKILILSWTEIVVELNPHLHAIQSSLHPSPHSILQLQHWQWGLKKSQCLLWNSKKKKIKAISELLHLWFYPDTFRFLKLTWFFSLRRAHTKSKYKQVIPTEPFKRCNLKLCPNKPSRGALCNVDPVHYAQLMWAVNGQTQSSSKILVVINKKSLTWWPGTEQIVWRDVAEERWELVIFWNIILTEESQKTAGICDVGSPVCYVPAASWALGPIPYSQLDFTASLLVFF